VIIAAGLAAAGHADDRGIVFSRAMPALSPQRVWTSKWPCKEILPLDFPIPGGALFPVLNALYCRSAVHWTQLRSIAPRIKNQ